MMPSWAERKKIDLRFHELSSDGYYQTASESGSVALPWSMQQPFGHAAGHHRRARVRFAVAHGFASLPPRDPMPEPIGRTDRLERPFRNSEWPKIPKRQYSEGRRDSEGGEILNATKS